jgi:transcriptional regulator with XRE-family HTH domain
MNRGAVRLKELLGERGAPARLAKELDVDPAMVSRWMNGLVSPDTTYRAKLEDEYGIGWRLWDDKLEEQPADTERAS